MMNLYHLKYFYDAALGKSLSEAAQKNRISRSAVSQAIKALEQTLNVELLHHRKNAFQLTSEGTILLEKCHGVFALMESIHDQVQTAKTAVSGTLSIAASHSISTSVLPGFLKQFNREFPRVAVNLFAGNSFRVRDLLRARQIDLGLGLVDSNFSEFAQVLLRKGFFVLASNRAEQKVTKDTKFLIGDRGEEVAFLRKNFQRRFKKSLPVLMEIQSWEVIAALVQQGLGAGLIPEFMLENGQRGRLKQIKTDLPLHPYELGAFFRDRDLLPRSAQVFLARLQEYNKT